MNPVRGEEPGTNWGGNLRYRARSLVRPETFPALAEQLAGAVSARILASRHSFNDMADAELLIGLDRLEDARRIVTNHDAMTVTVGAAVTYAELAEALNGEGLALENLASLPHISVAGAIGSATHGSGDRLGNLATAVRGIELMTADGERVTLDDEDPRLAGAAVHLGALGVVLSVTLAVVPHFMLSQYVYDELEWDALFEHFEAVYSMGHSVSVFHRLGERIQAVWIKARPDRPMPPTLFGATAAAGPRHPIRGVDPVNCTPQLGEPGPWSERLPHFRSGFMPSAGAEIQSELFIARRDAAGAIAALSEVAESIRPQLLVCELRTIAADGLWMSPHFGRDSLGLHFTWQREPKQVAENVDLIESVLTPFSPRPHWGKVSGLLGRGLASESLERTDNFARLREELDPRGVFSNPWLRRCLPDLFHGVL